MISSGLSVYSLSGGVSETADRVEIWQLGLLRLEFPQFFELHPQAVTQRTFWTQLIEQFFCLFKNIVAALATIH